MKHLKYKRGHGGTGLLSEMALLRKPAQQWTLTGKQGHHTVLALMKSPRTKARMLTVELNVVEVFPRLNSLVITSTKG